MALHVERTVLVAHDDEMARANLKEALKETHASIRIVEATNSDEACAKIGSRLFDLLIFEMGRPNLDSRSILSSLEDLPTVERPKATLIVSDLIDQGFLQVELENLTYLRKSHKQVELIGTMRSLLALREAGI